MEQNQVVFKSLYDYLGKRAGSELGKIVYQTARQDKVQMQQREVSNPLYTGKVMMYPVDWLDNYFNKLKEINDNNLPF
jgi:uncharacterized protein YqgQ